METARIARSTGLAGITGAVAFAAAGVAALAGAVPDWLDATLSAVAFAGMTVLLLGLIAVRAAGLGRLGPIALGLWAVGTFAVVAAQFVSAAGVGDDSNPLLPVGGLGQALGGLLGGIAVARAGVLPGWRRYAPLAWGVYFAAVLLPFGFAGTGVGDWLLLGLPVVVGVTAVALMTAYVPAGAPARPRPATVA